VSGDSSGRGDSGGNGDRRCGDSDSGDSSQYALTVVTVVTIV
jgi:hypothetical protein